MTPNIIKNHKINYVLKIRSIYIMKHIFNNILQNKLLNIIRYNKNIMKKLNIQINNYKEEYFKIVIAIIPVEGKYGKFININDKYKANYHIYFDNNKEEIKRDNINKDDKFNKIIIIIDYDVKSFSKLFFNCEYIKNINFIQFKRKDIKNMSYMFHGCSSIEEINLSNFKTDNVTNMKYMLSSCSSLKKLNLSNFDTSKVTNMKCMFYFCMSLEEIDIFSFITFNVKTMEYMFFCCFNIKKIDASNFSNNSLQNMNWMFGQCYEIKELNFSNFNNNHNFLYNLCGIFINCIGLKKIKYLKI